MLSQERQSTEPLIQVNSITNSDKQKRNCSQKIYSLFVVISVEAAVLTTTFTSFYLQLWKDQNTQEATIILYWIFLFVAYLADFTLLFTINYVQSMKVRLKIDYIVSAWRATVVFGLFFGTLVNQMRQLGTNGTLTIPFIIISFLYGPIFCIGYNVMHITILKYFLSGLLDINGKSQFASSLTIYLSSKKELYNKAFNKKQVSQTKTIKRITISNKNDQNEGKK